MTRFIARYLFLVVLLVLYVVLAVTYSLVTPVFEASDEISHYPVVEHIATTGELPVQRPGVETLWEQEGSQPPLYYLAGAALTFWIDTDDLEELQWRNPHAKLGVPLDPDNKNMIIHTERERFPWQGTVLAVHLIRFFSVSLGAVSVVLTYLVAREIAPDDPWLPNLAAALVAFNPMYLFICGSVNNDNLTILLSTWVILLCLRIVQTGFSYRRSITLAVVASLATITKISGLTLIPLIGLTLLLRAWRWREWRGAILAGITLGVSCLIIAGWWYARNLVLYQELLGLDTHTSIAGTRSIDVFSLVTQEWYGFWVSYWALFGAVNILVSPRIYLFYGLLTILSIGGVGLWAYRRIQERQWRTLVLPSLLAFQIVVVLIGVIRWTMTTYASQGRLMFPMIGAISTLMALGLLHLEVTDWRKQISIAVAAVLAVIAAFAPFRYIAPAYALPPAVEQVPESAIPVQADFGDLRLLAIKAERVSVEEGGRIPITLYWSAVQPIDTNYSVYLHALGRAAQEIGKIDTYPGGGTLPTTRMEPGAIIEDQYWIELDPDFDAPTRLRVQVGVGVYDDEGFTPLTPTLADGQILSSVTVDAGVAYPAGGCEPSVSDEGAALATFGDFADLHVDTPPVVAAPGDTVPVSLIWDLVGETPIDWTVFVQMIGEDGTIAAQADAPPLQGDYPTSLWRRACQFEDIHSLVLADDVPPGQYQILVGLYDTADPALPRAPATTRGGQPYPNNAVPLGTIQVELP